MNEFIRIDILGVEPDIINVLMDKYDNSIKIINNYEENIVQLQIPKFLQNNFLLIILDEFLSNFKKNIIHELIPSWFFDESNALIKGPSKKNFLTSREVLFLKMLLKKDKIITYSEMTQTLWQDGEEVTQNAMRLFTKNIKKKLPPNILKNFQNIGYKLIL